MRVTNKARWTRTKAVTASLLMVTGLGAFKQLESGGPIPDIWPLGVLICGVAFNIMRTCKPQDF